jgi:hypothetical protein
VAVRVRFPTPALREGEAGARHLYIPGLEPTDAVGSPVYPYRGVLVALPAGARYELLYEAAGTVPIPGSLPVEIRRPPTVTIGFDGHLRHRRVVQLLFHPLEVNADGDGSLFHREVTARLRLSGGEAAGFAPGGATEEALGPLERTIERGLYRGAVLNEDRLDPAAYGRAWDRRFRPGRATGTERGTVLESAGAAAKLRIRGEGIWSVTYEDLMAAGIDPGSPSSTDLSLTSGGTARPLRVLDGGDGVFGPGDRLEFFGAGIAGNKDYDRNVYRLAFDEGPGLPMPTRAAAPAGGSTPGTFPETLRFEINEQLFTTAADSDGDQFGWARLVYGSAGSSAVVRDFPETALAEAADLISLPGLDPGALAVTVRARIYGLAGTSHTTAILLNGVDLLDSRTWSGVDATHEATTSATNLQLSNTLTVELTGAAYNQVLVNWVEVDYPRLFEAEGDALIFTSDLAAPVAHQVTGFSTDDIVVYDITDPTAPVLLGGVAVGGSPGSYTASFTDTVGGVRRFLARAGTAAPDAGILADAPSDLTDPGHAADLIILSYRDFLPELAPLVAHREAQGMRVELVDLDDVYDEFSYGLEDPQAIRDFVEAAFFGWQAPAPSFLLLVGNATLDPRQLLSGSVPQLMPSGEFQAPTLGVASSDNFFVTVAGADPLPDLVAGRLPVQTPQETADAVARIIAYDAVDPALLNQKMLFVADNGEVLFEAIQEDMISLYLTDTRLPVDRAYLRVLGTGPTNQKIRDGINAGALHTNYLGHGNIHNWAAENIFVDSTDVPLLTNADRPTFLTTLNCINGLHAAPRAPNVSSLAEQVLLATTGGAIGVWSPSALGTLVDYQSMSGALYEKLYVDRVQTLGLAATAAKVGAYVNDGVSAANLEEMTYFGDPTVALRVDGDLDGLLDVEEDGCDCGLDPRDADSDDDGLTDGLEPDPYGDADGDGAVNVVDPDADDDGLPDGLESGVSVPDPDTDIARGMFHPDLEPASTTDPLAWDTDGGGAADGAEDRDGDGQVGAGETDPLVPGDDPACGPGPLPEIDGLLVGTSGQDLTLSWTGIEGEDPCVLYKVLAADLGPGPLSFAPLGTTGSPAAELPGAAAGPTPHAFLLVATRPDLGDGPSGH